MPPALLLTLTFLLGAGLAFTVPAYQAMIPDLVPRSQLSSASALGSINVNLARAVGPAIAGVLIARTGVGAVFALNTATFLVYGLVAAWASTSEHEVYCGELASNDLSPHSSRCPLLPSYVCS